MYRLIIILILLVLPVTAQAPDRTFARNGIVEGTLQSFSGDFIWTAKQSTPYTWRAYRIRSGRGPQGERLLTVEQGYFVTAPPEQGGGQFFITQDSATLGLEAALALRDGLAESFPVVSSSVSSSTPR